MFVPADIIRKKRFQTPLTEEEIRFFIDGYTKDEIPDYQMAAFIMAVCFQGMSDPEVSWLTRYMRDSGVVLDFSKFAPAVVDKHSTGGVGDKTSLILAPLVASTGIKVPMIAGRGLGHTGGTLDKLEAIPGFNVQLSLDRFQTNIEEKGYSIIGQTKEICPTDKKLYALRDVTGTVDSIPLICGSIMSKKLAEGLNGLVLDVKFGSGAFMKTLDDAEKLANALSNIGALNGVSVSALLTSMEQPLGRFIGNALEVQECLDIMRGTTHSLYADTIELTLRLAAEMIYLGGKANSPDEGYQVAKDALSNGTALKFFEEMVAFQGGTSLELSRAQYSKTLSAEEDGYISEMNVEGLGMASLMLGAGRMKSTDIIDPSAGIEMIVELGSKVKKGDEILTLFYSNSTEPKAAIERAKNSIKFSSTPLNKVELIQKRIFREKTT